MHLSINNYTSNTSLTTWNKSHIMYTTTQTFLLQLRTHHNKLDSIDNIALEH